MSTKKQSFKYRVRKFLNDDLDLPAMIVAIVPELGVDRHGQKSSSLSPTLTISDCSRQINLDFGFYDKEDKKKMKKKVIMFRDIINSFSEAMLEVIEEAEQVEKNDTSTKK